jgi:antitoxin (DNA-binding transcriptional repressor) of toxin-antitoxin stability system
MQKATIAELKNKLSAYLRKVRAGDTVLVLDRKRPIARIERIGPHDRPRDRTARERLARLEAAGLVTRPAAALPLKALRAPPPRAPGGAHLDKRAGIRPRARRSVLKALLDERAEDR